MAHTIDLLDPIFRPVIEDVKELKQMIVNYTVSKKADATKHLDTFDTKLFNDSELESILDKNFSLALRFVQRCKLNIYDNRVREYRTLALEIEKCLKEGVTTNEKKAIEDGLTSDNYKYKTANAYYEHVLRHISNDEKLKTILLEIKQKIIRIIVNNEFITQAFPRGNKVLKLYENIKEKILSQCKLKLQKYQCKCENFMDLSREYIDDLNEDEQELFENHKTLFELVNIKIPLLLRSTKPLLSNKASTDQLEKYKIEIEQCKNEFCLNKNKHKMKFDEILKLEMHLFLEHENNLEHVENIDFMVKDFTENCFDEINKFIEYTSSIQEHTNMIKIEVDVNSSIKEIFTAYVKSCTLGNEDLSLLGKRKRNE